MNRSQVDATKPDAAGSGPIERAMLAVQRRARRSLSPWMQRALDRSALQRPVHAETQVQLHAQHLMRRVQRRLDSAVMLRPNLGSVEPAMVQRFSSQISNRFTPLITRHQPEAAQAADANNPLEMPLAEGASMADTVNTPATPAPGTPESYLDQAPIFDQPVPPSVPAPSVASPVAPAIQRMPEDNPAASRMQQLREALAAKMSGRSGQPAMPSTSQDAAVPGVSPTMPAMPSTPRPSASRVRRVARVEEIDPFAIAAQNAQREEQPSASTPPAPAPKVGPPARPLIQRQVNDVARPAHRPDEPRLPQQEMPSIHTPALGPNGEYSPLQRIRQARAAQLQRQASNRVQPDAPVHPATTDKPALTPEVSPPAEQSAPPPGPVDIRPTQDMPVHLSGAVDVHPSQDKPIQPSGSVEVRPTQGESVLQRQTIEEASEPTHPEGKDTDPGAMPVEQRQKSASAAQEEPLPPAVPDRPAPTPERIQRTPAQPPETEKAQAGVEGRAPLRPEREPNEPKGEETPPAPLSAGPAAPMLIQRSATAPAESPSEKPGASTEEPKPGSVELTRPAALPIQRAVEQPSEPQAPSALHPVLPPAPSALQPALTIDDKVQREQAVLPQAQQSTQTAEDTSLAGKVSFANHVMNRAATHLEMPLTLRRKPAAMHTYVQAPMAGELREVALPPQAEPPVVRSMTQPVQNTAASVIQRSAVEPPPQGIDVQPAKPLAEAGFAPVRIQVIERAQVPAPSRPVTPPALPLRTPLIQRKVEQPQNHLVSAAPVVLPQVRQILDQPFTLRDATPETGGEGLAQRQEIHAPVRGRVALNTTFPLVQRSLNSEMPVNVSPVIERVQRVKEEHTPLPLVTRKLAASATEQHADEQQPPPPATVAAAAQPEPEPVQPAPVNLNQLARDIYPLIRRMLNVERERIRGI